MRRILSCSQKIEVRTFPADFCTPLVVALSPGHNDITRFHPWLQIATGNHLDHAEKNPKVAQMTGTLDVFDPRSGISGPTLQRAFACLNLHE